MQTARRARAACMREYGTTYGHEQASMACMFGTVRVRRSLTAGGVLACQLWVLARLHLYLVVQVGGVLAVDTRPGP